MAHRSYGPLAVSAVIARILDKLQDCVDDRGRMFRKFVTVLVVLGWVSLSCFDVVEDLDGSAGKGGVWSSSPDDSSTAKRGGWGPLANNIIESANETKQTAVGPTNFTPIAFKFNRVIDLRRHFPLHKLYRVFLI
jgi:hypothetical protein